MVDLTAEDAFDCRECDERRNVVAVQPCVTPTDYASEGAFSLMVKGYLEAARDRDWLGERTLVVFPEYLGTWLVTMHESPAVYRAKTAKQAMRSLARAHPLAYARDWLRTPTPSPGSGARGSGHASPTAPARAKYAVFALKARRMAEVYQRVFAELARIYRVTIVAGSILLPEPRLQDGVLVAGRGPLANVSVIYRYDGAAVALSREVFPTETELPFVAPGCVEDLPVLNTGAGRLGVLVCADSWYPEVYQHLRARRVEIVAVASCREPADLWDDPWRGYSGAPAPQDVAPGDVGRLTEREAWAKYGMAGRIASCGASAGVNVCLRGRLWDLEFGGGATVYREGEARQLEGAALVNVWL